MKNFHAKIILFSLLAIWVTGILSSLILPATNLQLLPVIKRIFSPVCHQQTHKTIFIEGKALMVCARCAGIYFGGFGAAFILLFLKKDIFPKIKFLFMAAIPMVLDIILYSSGIYSYNKFISFFTGFLFGSAALFYIYVGLIDFFVELKLKRNYN